MDTVITGRVKRYSRQHMGSFKNVLVEGQRDFVTIWLGYLGRYPEVGEVITVLGVMRDGRFLTNTWHFGAPQ